MSYDELVKLRENARADPAHNISFYMSFYEQWRKIGPDKIKSAQNINELNTWLTGELERVTGGHHENLKFYSEHGAYQEPLKLFGTDLHRITGKIRSIYAGEIAHPEFRPANRIYLPGPFRAEFMDYSADAAFINSDIARRINLKSSSYYIKIAGVGLRLYFSPDVRGPLCSSNYDIYPCEKKSQLINLGNIILPAKLARRIAGYGIKGEIPSTPDEAIASGLENGTLHPNYAIPQPPPDVEKLRIRDLEFRPSPAVLTYLVNSGMLASLKKDSIVVDDEIFGPILQAALDGKLKGVNMPDNRIWSIEIIEQMGNGKDINIYHGIVPVRGQVIPRIATRYCTRCQRITPFRRCESCGSRTVKLYFCNKCGKPIVSQTCPTCGSAASSMPDNDAELSESLRLASKKLNLDMRLDLAFPDKSVGEIEDIRKVILRRRASILASECGVSAFLAHGEAANLNPDEIIIPHRLASSLLDVARFIDAEIEEIYGGKRIFSEYSPKELIGRELILLNRDLSAGIRLKVREIGSEVLVNPGVLKKLCMGLRNNSLYVSLEEDVILNYSGKYCDPPRYLNIYGAGSSKTLPKIRIDYSAKQSRESIVDLSKSLMQLIISLKDKKVAVPQLVKTLTAVEIMYNNQAHSCPKCGLRFLLPPLSYRCPICGSELSPEFDTEMLNTIIISLRNVADMLENDEKEEIELILERFQGMFKSDSQLSLSEFS
ncbi:MAG: hypothetical protein JRN26_06050 [Nitrososphaerota archaeon]|jgi:hypothetical protein|nr:hypothetical protein [Nitrososphaerota archaeon]MDG6927010.1 hypothetical protein [Nitrososphaerota archaeon]MDG6930429.1 hypothetical protein [Nitrososphaerota archaeon]MDG6931470.1 hypothetical protein [Nitrososphaerota archaeon]MDG6936425.1 hypothetical protein [Nitrososphaerota archaeon]